MKFGASPQRIEILTPLLKWKYLPLSLLKKQSNYQGTDNAFRRIILRLENESYLKSIKDPQSNFKFIYLGPEAMNCLNASALYLKEETRYHDALLSTLMLRIKEISSVISSELGQPDFEHNQSSFSDHIDEDGKIQITKNGDLFTIGIELELTRKSSSRIKHKFKLIHFSSPLSIFIYFMESKDLIDIYLKYLLSYLAENNIPIEKSKIFFAHIPNFLLNQDKLSLAKVYGRGRERLLQYFLV